MHTVNDIRLLLAVLAPLLGAGLVMATGKRPNLRETCSFLAAATLFGITVSLVPAVRAGNTLHWTVFELAGREQSLDLYWLDGYGGGVFLSFADATSGTETYGACRYLLDTVKGSDLGERDGRLVLDFNFAYNPSCAYDPRWVCPLAPPGNRLPEPIRGGERLSA